MSSHKATSGKEGDMLVKGQKTAMEELGNQYNMVVEAANEMLKVLKLHGLMNESDVLKIMENANENVSENESKTEDDINGNFGFFKSWTRGMDIKELKFFNGKKERQETNVMSKARDNCKEFKRLVDISNEIWKEQLIEARIELIITQYAYKLEKVLEANNASILATKQLLNRVIDEFIDFVAKDDKIPAITRDDNGDNKSYLKPYFDFVNELTRLRESDWQEYNDCIKFNVKVFRKTKVKRNAREGLIAENIDNILLFPRPFTFSFRLRLFRLLNDNFIQSVTDEQVKSKILSCKLNVLNESLKKPYYNVARGRDYQLENIYIGTVKYLFGTQNEERMYYYIDQFDSKVDYSVFSKALRPRISCLTYKRRHEYKVYTALDFSKNNSNETQSNKNEKKEEKEQFIIDEITGVARTPEPARFDNEKENNSIYLAQIQAMSPMNSMSPMHSLSPRSPLMAIQDFDLMAEIPDLGPFVTTSYRHKESNQSGKNSFNASSLTPNLIRSTTSYILQQPIAKQQ